MSTYTSSSTEGAQGVIDDIADRRRRLHYLKDRSISRENFNLRDNGEDRRGSYKAWGRTQSGVLAESLLTPKEINLIWAWFSPAMTANSKYDLVSVKTLMDQFMLASVFETFDATNDFMQSITKKRGDAVSFVEITSAISTFEVSTEHVFDLRQFAKKLKKEKKNRPLSGKGSSTNTHLDASFSRGQEVARKSLMNKAKSENNARGVFSPLNLSSSDALPVIKPSSMLGSAPSDSFIAERRKSPSNASSLASRHAPLLKANSRKKMNINVAPSLSPVDTASLSPSKSPSSSSSKSSLLRIKLPLSKQGSDSDGSLLSLSPPPLGNGPIKSPRQLHPLGQPVLSPRKKDRNKNVRLNEDNTTFESQNTGHFSPNTGNSAIISPRKGILKSIKVEEVPAPAPQEPQPLQGLRKKFHRQLSRMATNENIQDEEDVPTKSLGTSKNIELARNSFRRKQPSERELEESRAGKSRITNFHEDEDEDLPTKSLGVSKNIDFARNSFRHKRPSARQLLDNVETASHLLQRMDSDLGMGIKRVDSVHSMTSTESPVVISKTISKHADEGTLTNLRRTFSRQLSRMASMTEGGEGNRSRSPKRSSPKVPALQLDTAAVVTKKRSHSQGSNGSLGSNSMQSITSFDSGEHLLRFDNFPSSRKSSYGDTIFLQEPSDCLDI